MKQFTLDDFPDDYHLPKLEDFDCGIDITKWPYHDGHVEKRKQKRNLWKTFYGKKDWKYFVKQYGDLQEVKQAYEELYVHKNRPEVTWKGGGGCGATLDALVDVPRITKPGSHEVSVKMGKVMDEGKEIDLLYFESLDFSTKETRIKNITRLEGPSHTELILKMYMHNSQRSIMNKALRDGKIEKMLYIDDIFPEESLQMTLVTKYKDIMEIYEPLAKKEKKAGSIVRDYILYAVTEAFMNNDTEKIDRLRDMV